MAEANHFLKEVYMPLHSARFAVPAEDQGSAFVPFTGALDDILCDHADRVVGDDNTVRYRGLILQIPPAGSAFRPDSSVAAPVGRRHADTPDPRDVPNRRARGNAAVRGHRWPGSGLVRSLVSVCAVAALVAIAAVLATAPAQAQTKPVLSLERGPHPASVSTARGDTILRYRVKSRHAGSFWCQLGRAGCRNEPGGTGSADPQVPITIDVEWKEPWLGYPLVSATEGALSTQYAAGKWYWDRTLMVVHAKEDRPLLAKVILSKRGDNRIDIGSSNTLLIAVNPQLKVMDDSAIEGTDSHLEFSVTLTPQATETVTVDYATSAGTATAGSDYTETSGTLTFNVGDRYKTIRVPIINDTVADSGETLTLTLSNPSGVTRLVRKQGGVTIPNPGLSPGECSGVYCNPGGLSPVQFAATVTATGTILNDEPGPDPSVDDLPLVTIQAPSFYTGEGSDALFTLTRTGDASAALTASVSVQEGGAMLDASAPTSATFAAGEQETELRVSTVDDDAVEDDSAVTVTVEAGSAYRLGANDSSEATVTVLDDDVAPAPDPTPASAGVTVWSADMTVVDYGSGGGLGAGTANLLANQGGSEGLQAKWLYYNTRERTLRMAFTTVVNAGDLTLHAGGVALSLAEGLCGGSSCTWENVDHPGWTDGQTFEARLVRGETAGSAASDATLASLAISGAELNPAFDPEVLLYTAVVDPGTASVTVSGAPGDENAGVAFGPSGDADPDQPGHQVAVPVGETLMTATATAADGETQRAYRVVMKRSIPAVTDDGGTEETLVSAATDPVAAVATLTASFEGMPAAHDGESVFTFRVRFSEALASKRKVVRNAFTVTGGSVSGQMRVNGQSDLWRIKIEPSGHGDVSIALPANVACDAGGLCTADGDVLSNAVSATVQGPPALTVADAEVEEAANATLDFVVSLSRATSGTVTVAYATSDGSAAAGADYTATGGTLSFAAGETSKTVSVPVLDDAHDEGEETLTLTLSNAVRGVSGRRHGDRHDREHRCDAAGVAGALRAHGLGAGAGCGGGASPGLAHGRGHGQPGRADYRPDGGSRRQAGYGCRGG